MAQPSISQYLISNCLLIIDEFNERYQDIDKSKLKAYADVNFNEMDITVKIGYPFRHMVHYTVGDGNKGIKSNHDLFIEPKNFKIEIKYLKTGITSQRGSFQIQRIGMLFKTISIGCSTK